MKVASAKEAARRWVTDVAADLTGFQGAFFHGSINWMPDEAPFPATSDVDVGVVIAGAQPPQRLGKTRYAGVLVEGAGIPASELATAEQLLGNCRIGHSFRTDSIIADPSGHLRPIQQTVARRFKEPRWVRARCEEARSNCLRYVRLLDEAPTYPAQAICWLFAEGNLAHVLLNAGMRNPTVRRRYSAVRELLDAAGRLDSYDALLTMLGCASMPEGQVAIHLEHMSDAFDAAVPLVPSELPFACDLSVQARQSAVDGSWELVRGGEHREAMFWIAVTFGRCMTVLSDGADRAAAKHDARFRALMEDLRVPSLAAMQRRAAAVEAYLPELMTLANEIASASSEVAS